MTPLEGNMAGASKPITVVHETTTVAASGTLEQKRGRS